jgi:broad specificity phosphatase PhoE
VPMKIYLVRHAQSEWQLKPCQDWNTSLTVLGHQQAQRMAQWLAECQKSDHRPRFEVASLCSSPLKRAQETAAYISDVLHLPLIIQKSLQEANFHVADHLLHADGPLQTPPAHPPSRIYAHFRAQAEAALRELVERAEAHNGSVLAVSHGGLLKTLLRRVVSSDTVCFRLYNTGVNLIEWRRGRWHLVHLNLWDHLPMELRTE